MPDKNRVGYVAFAQWEVELAEGKAKGLIGKHGFTRGDYEDLRQDLLLQIHLKRETTMGWTEVTASERTVMSRILDNYVRDMIDAVHADKRKVHLFSESIHDASETGLGDEGKAIVDEEFIFRRMEKLVVHEEKDLEFDLRAVFQDLNSIQKRVCELLLSGTNISDAARALHMKRTTLNREVERLRKVFYKRGLKNYV